MTIRAMIDGSTVAAVITDPRLPDNPIIACNRAFEVLTGYRREEVVGRNCRFLAGERSEPLLTNEIAAAVRERRPLLAEIPNFKKNGSPFRNAILIVPIFDDAGRLIYFLGSQSEVPETPSAKAGPRGELPTEKLASLTARQQQVLYCMVTGLRNKQTGQLLGISERTVKMHRAEIFRVLAVTTSADAIRLAVEAHWHIDYSAATALLPSPVPPGAGI